MPLESAKGIVLGSNVFKERDKIVQILTENSGIIKIVAHGSSKRKNRFGSLFELFTFGEFFFYRKEDKELSTLSKGDVIQSYFDTVSESGRIFYFYLIAEIVLKFVPKNFNSERVYKLLNSILIGSSKGVDMKYILLFFMIWILRIEGMMFESRRCCKCGENNLTKSWVTEDFRGVLCNLCRVGEMDSIGMESIKFIEWTKRNGLSSKYNNLTSEFCKELFQILKNKIEYHGEIILNSSRYLSDLN